MREACERYGIPYNVGPLHRQFGSVVAKICRLALPDPGSSARPGRGGALRDGLGGAARLLGGAAKGGLRRLRP